ncbi:serine hydrolase domain-containing protein [Jiangella asiatica]|uniref:Class A beta-lactamase-related serine hydrolase n=1 Tax=Jiangella asiatica TaxID=2530372 RepID=A0A4R5CA15_9ACTN|nr:serine hydrolase domain-containing protein [Jiangella asiatica]TDD95020.1 class A beta-lactamase-related serine hydrolase [Jiangella asiatica]
MTHQPSGYREPSRRSLLRALGAAPVVAAGVLAASPAASAVVPARSAEKGRVPQTLRPGGQLDRYVAERAARDEFSGTVLIAYRGDPVLTRSHGMADKDRDIPNRPDTIFNLASVTKIFTGLAVMQLAAKGELGIHDTLGGHLDGFAAEPAGATLHQLLTHTSGVGRDATGPDVGIPSEWDSLEVVWDGVLGAIREIPTTKFPPGNGNSYSNDAFWLLGAIVATVSGEDYFYDYVRQHIFQPAGMRDTDYYTRPQVQGDRDIAHQYPLGPDGQRFDFTMGEQFPFVGGPDGGAYSTVEDMLHFATALQDDELLDRSFTDIATRGKLPKSPARDETASHLFTGYGCHDYVYRGQRIYGNDGGGPGAGANLDIFPGLDWVTVVVTNYGDTPTTVKPIVNLARELIVDSA